jgi:hypothetical protein
VTRGRCYDHNFLRFLTIFGETIGVFLKNQCYDQNFAKFSFVLSQKRQFFTEFFGENIFKIITSVPDCANFRPLGDCLLWVFLKIAKVAHNFGPLFPQFI